MKFKNNARDGSDLCVSVSVCSFVCACIVYIWYCTPRIYVFVGSSSVFLGILHYVLFILAETVHLYSVCCAYSVFCKVGSLLIFYIIGTKVRY